MNQVDKAIARGIVYLQSTQARDGSFVTFAYEGQQSFPATHPLATTFGPALILGALASIDTAKKIREKLANWLLAQKNLDGSFNYWATGAEERTSRPYPNDLDDTCCSLIGLYLHNPRLIDCSCLAKIVRLLLSAEQKIGGPYKTWLVPKNAPSAWQNIDLAVNANVAYFLRLVAQPLPNLQIMMERAITTQNFGSPYYPIPFVVVYFVARAYQGKATPRLVKYILSKQKNGHWPSPGQTALALSALHYAKQKSVAAARTYLLSQQQADGSWPAEAMWLDEVSSGRKIYAGSPALTTAFVLEALGYSKKTVAAIKRKQNDDLQKAMRPLVSEAQHCLQQLDNPLRQQGLGMLTSLTKGRTGPEILLLPQMFAQSVSKVSTLPKAFYQQLSLANLFGWMAYTIYDDFLDDEGQPELLPVATFAMRQSLTYFRQALPKDAAFQQKVQSVFDRIDTANAWEVMHCRFKTDGQNLHLGKLPKYQKVTFLAERSIGHGLTPLAVLASLGLALDDPRVALFEKAFQHYLTARQLNDDLHDWQEDFSKGHITYVVAHILSELSIKAGVHSLSSLQKKTNQQFWHQTLPKLCGEVRNQIRLSEQALTKSGLLQPDHVLGNLLQNLDGVMIRTLGEQQKAIQFLQAYKQK